MIPVAIWTGWLYSIAFISAVSIYANIASHLAAWRADVPTPPDANADANADANSTNNPEETDA